MLNAGQKDRILEMGKDSRYQYYMTVTFPNWLAALPGGKFYDPAISREMRVTDWTMACFALVTQAKMLGIFLDGWPAVPNRYPDPEFFIRKYCYAHEVRKLRRKWNDRMEVLGLPHGRELWVGKTVGEAEVRIFRDTVEQLFPSCQQEKV